MRRVHSWLAGAAAAIGLSAAAPASAAVIYSDYVVVYNGSGKVVRFVGATAAQDAGTTLTVVPIAVDPSKGKDPTVITGAGGLGNGDVVGVCAHCGEHGGAVLAFTPDGDPGLLLKAGDTPRTASEGSTVDITLYLSKSLQAKGYTAFFVSSDDGVPEPASWTLMLLGVGLAGVALRRRPDEARR